MARLIDGGLRAIDKPMTVNLNISQFYIGGRVFSLAKDTAKVLGEARIVKLLLSISCNNRCEIGPLPAPLLKKRLVSQQLFEKHRKLIKSFSAHSGFDPLEAINSFANDFESQSWDVDIYSSRLS